jgi:hypothetical protein
LAVAVVFLSVAGDEGVDVVVVVAMIDGNLYRKKERRRKGITISDTKVEETKEYFKLRIFY